MLVAGYFLDDSFVMYKNSWTPTTDLNQAMMCVEKLERKYPFALELDRYGGVYSGGKWICAICRDIPEFAFNGDNDCEQGWEQEKEEGGFPQSGLAADDSPSLAICKAILEALDE